MIRAGGVALLVALAVSFLLGIPVTASAATFLLRAFLSGREAVPSAVTGGVGLGTFQYDDVTNQLTFTVGAFNLQGSASALQIHGPALPGVNAPALFTLPAGNFVSGTLTFTEAQETDLLAGNFYVNAPTSVFPDGEVRGQIGQALLFAAVLPSSRSVQVGTPATAFATIVNAGPSAATGCSIAPATTVPATFVYQTTDPGSNLVTGTADTPVTIAPGSQSFVFAFTPTAPVAPTDVQLAFDCANSPPALLTSGLNTLLLSASATPVPDVVAVAVGNLRFPSGTVHVPPGSTGAFAVAAYNVGAGGTITVTADASGSGLPLTAALCQTNASTAQCIAPLGGSVNTTLAAGGFATYAVILTSTGPPVTPFDPVRHRVIVRFRDGGGIDRGSTSLAILVLP